MKCKLKMIKFNQEPYSFRSLHSDELHMFSLYSCYCISDDKNMYVAR